MMISMPSDDFLKGLGPQRLANEDELQRFIEDYVAPACGLRLVSSSLPRGTQLRHAQRDLRCGKIDTAAIDHEGRPVIIEYKWDRVNRDTIKQLARYKQWLLNNCEVFEKEVSELWKGQSTNWKQILLISLGYRYHQSAAWSSDDDLEVISLRYGYRADGTVLIQQVDRRTLPPEGDPPLDLSKDHYLDQHLARTTVAARQAFQLLRRRIVELELAEKIHGKNRVTYGAKPCLVEVRFNDVALQCFFVAGDDIEDPEGRAKRIKGKKRLSWTCGIVSPADVEYVMKLLGSVKD
jgi:hypothetical protein